jgi:hypothetical protein
VTLLIIFLPPALATPLWLAYVALGSCGVLTYAIATRQFPAEMAGRVNTTLNFIVFFVAFMGQWLFGVILEFFPDGEGGATRLGFQVALGTILAIQVLSYLPLLLPARGAATSPVRAG